MTPQPLNRHSSLAPDLRAWLVAKPWRWNYLAIWRGTVERNPLKRAWHTITFPHVHEDDDPMPVFVIKARDNLAEATVRDYMKACAGLWDQDQAWEVSLALAEIKAWRERNPEKCKWPDHRHVPAGQPGSGSEAGGR